MVGQTLIEEYHEISNGGSALSDGMKTHVTYSDSNVGKWGFSVCDFVIRPVDNMERDTVTQQIKSLPEEVEQKSYIPLNLVHMANKDYVTNASSIDSMSNVESFNNFGEVDTSNMFKQYFLCRGTEQIPDEVYEEVWVEGEVTELQSICEKIQ